MIGALGARGFGASGAGVLGVTTADHNQPGKDWDL